MKHTMKKFSAGGAQGRYDRRMADIEKDYAKAMKRKTGKDAEVAEAKRQQRIADAKDDLAKRTGADRTATRAAERAAESNLKKTRKYGAPKSVTKDELITPGKMTESLSLPKMDSSIGKKPAAKPVQKTVQKPAATTPKRMGDQGFAYKKKDMPTTGKGVSTHYRYVRGGSNSGAAADGTAAQRLKNKGLETGTTSTTSTGKGGVNSGRSPGILSGFSFGETGGYKGRGNITVQPREARQTSSSNNAANDAAAATRLATLKKAAEAPGATEFAKDRYKRAVSSGMYAKGGKIMKKFAAGGVTKEMPSSKAMGSLGMKKGGKVKKMAVGGQTTIYMPKDRGARMEDKAGRREARMGERTERREANMARRDERMDDRQGRITQMQNRFGGMRTGTAGTGAASTPPAASPASTPPAAGAAYTPPAAGGGRSTVDKLRNTMKKREGGSVKKKATKFGAAMFKKSADTKGRAMKKMAKGGGIESKGKTNTKMVKMAKGGSIDGIAQRGKTKLKRVTMKKGGAC